jgi:predicted O-linked N-acetylglucosamine transferase (SPINDLY family)
MMRADATLPDDAAKLDSACASAMQYQLAGQLDLAGQLYSAILQAAPAHPAANYCLGMLHVQSQHAADGLPYLKAALQARLDVVDYWLGYLEALTLAGQIDAARNILALGVRQGIAGKAVDEFAERLRAQDSQAGKPAQPPSTPPATATSHKKRAKRPRNERDIRKQESVMLSLVERRENDAALELARDLTKRFPKRGFGWKILGAFMPTDDGYDAAIEVMRTAVRLLPHDAEALVNLGITLAKVKSYPEAEEHLHQALRINPRLPAAHFRLAMIYEYQGRYADSEASLRRGRSFGVQPNAVAGDDELSYSHLLFLMGHNPSIDADEFFAENCRYGEYIESKLRPLWPAHRNHRTPERCLKIGFVSGDFRNHSVANFLEPVLEQLKSRPRLDLHGYYTNTQYDDTTRRIRARFSNWKPAAMLSDDRLAAQIMEDSIDILVDLSGHTGSNRLPVFARKPAPVQVSWLGYPATTGLQSMDYYLADPQWLPPGKFDRQFTEKLVFLPDRWAFVPHPDTPAVGPLPALQNGHLTFGSFHRRGKINPPTIHLWSQLLLALPQARMLLAGIPLDGERDALLREFAAQGVDLARLTVHDRSAMDAYLALHNEVDIALDTQPYGGATTTMHSLSMGVPTLTISGATSMSRACTGILSHVGLEAFATQDAADFVARARYWSDNLAALADLRACLRTRHSRSPGGQPTLIAAHIEAALRHMWRRWCAGLPPESFHSSTHADG